MRILTSKTGYRLFNGSCLSEKVYLGTCDSPDNWKEITIEEANAWEEEQARLEEERLAEEARLESERNS